MAQKRKLDAKKYREALKTERERLMEQIRRIDDRTAGRDRLDSHWSAEDFDEPGGDAAADTLERSQAMALGENFRDMLAHVDHALEKMDKGSKRQAIQLFEKAVKIEETPERWVELTQLYHDEGEEILADFAMKKWKQLSGHEPVKEEETEQEHEA